MVEVARVVPASLRLAGSPHARAGAVIAADPDTSRDRHLHAPDVGGARKLNSFGGEK
jgi:hypothetical protein